MQSRPTEQGKLSFYRKAYSVRFNKLTLSHLAQRLDSSAGKDETAAFLSSLKVLWRGFIHMASVAKLVTKAFPLSGILDNLTEVSLTCTSSYTFQRFCMSLCSLFCRTFQIAFKLVGG